MYQINQQELQQQFIATRNYSEEICKPLAPEDYVPQPIVDVSPPKWHLAHTTWFFEQMVLVENLKGYEVFNDKYAFLFNSYYNTLGERTKRDQRGFMSRPTVEEIYEYRKYVTNEMLELLENELNQETLSIIELGINHEQQHQELLAYDIKYILGNSSLLPDCGKRLVFHPEPQKQKWIKLNEGIYEIGADGSSFYFDIEMGKHKVYLEEAHISNKLITNGEYLQFVKDGGYANHYLWHDEGWYFINEKGINAPLHWHKKDNHWMCYSHKNLEKLNLDAPVSHISFYEAHAFAEWAGYRLPTEFEWEATADQFQWGQLWEWTNSAFLPYPRYQKKVGAVGEYNGKFMVNLMVLRGASVGTPANHSRKTYRNFFHTGARWLFSGIRVAKKNL